MEAYWSGLRAVIQSYDAFCRVAEELDWMELTEHHVDWHRRSAPPGILLDMYEFPSGYLPQNMVSAYVRTCLSGAACAEGWDRNFWRQPREERVYCLTAGRALYEGYAILREVRMCRRSWDWLVREIMFFAGENGVTAEEQQTCLALYAGAEVIELGGYCIGDFVYLAVKEDRMLVVSCGIWD